MKHLFLSALLLVLSVNPGYCQETFSNTVRLDERVASPRATLQDVAWVQGHWKGEAFGGFVEEIWTPPLGGSMMCAFKLVVNNKVRFYEIVTLSEENSTLMLRLKHFHKDLKGWEEKDETVDFPLVKMTPGKMFFDGFTFERISENEMNIYVIIEQEDKEREAKFNYKRVL
ncbi:hypothetical protein G3570_13635 [Balneolaceae bacterium YR4-1]|uniref:DUF6265 domain-containing protein n=1 Tax=Halalkalibaculum roseum TaxID=2709311 RepID=A0A6M1T2E2_9BACT|nr:DUF6265 family protein [Halalkalibaculum roseum]NGP77684.1 hypothetical protein [Halalkalibaculum roseum]